MQYFTSRIAAGSLIADKLVEKYRHERCAVIALGDGAVLVGAVIASRLRCPVNMLLTESIHLQGEPDVLAAIDHQGSLTYNPMYSESELEDMKGENLNYIEQQKMQKKFELNRLVGRGGVISNELLEGRTIIVVSDGLPSGLPMRAATEYLKPIKVHKLVMAAPFASVTAVDDMHVLADDIVCLNVLEDVISVDHYYEDNHLPSHEEVIKIVESLVSRWRWWLITTKAHAAPQHQ